ncbi:MAG: hypothetical protein R3Y08_02105 [Rikenellaceae bacterium]
MCTINIKGKENTKGWSSSFGSSVWCYCAVRLEGLNLNNAAILGIVSWEIYYN